MTRFNINRLSGTAPVAMSLIALLLVFSVVVTGWERTATDEGIAAHLFQMLVVLQLPIGIAFLATADWSRSRVVLSYLLVQAIALAAAFGAVALVGL